MMKAALHTGQRNHLSAGEWLVRTGVGSSFDRPGDGFCLKSDRSRRLSSSLKNQEIWRAADRCAE